MNDELYTALKQLVAEGYADGVSEEALQKGAEALDKAPQLPSWEDTIKALATMVWQFGHRGTKNEKPIMWTGGLSALEEAFEVLGWDDPHYLPIQEGYCCEVEGCVEQDTIGTFWDGLYLRLCSSHGSAAFQGHPMPPIRQWALDREVNRDKVTERLPVRKE